MRTDKAAGSDCIETEHLLNVHITVECVV